MDDAGHDKNADTSLDTRQAPDFHALERLLCHELRRAIELLASDPGHEPLSVLVLWADPRAGLYEVLADTQSRNEAAARQRNAEMVRQLDGLIDSPDAWRAARSLAQSMRALPFNPRYKEFAFAELPVHQFQISFTQFLASPAYAELNASPEREPAEEEWLAAKMRFAITRALHCLVREEAFASLHAAPLLRLGYAYPESSDALVVAYARRATS